MNDKETVRLSLRWSTVGELSSRVSHESNNLLAGILGQAELGLLSADPARMKASLESIVRSSRELKSLMERLLGFAKMVEPGHRTANLVEIFRTMYGLLERAFVKAGIQTEQRFGPIPTTWCDPGAVAPSLLFCLRSALDMCRKAGGGRMTLEAASVEGQVMFRVTLEPPEGKSFEAASGRSSDLSFAQASEMAAEDGGRLEVNRAGETWIFSCVFPLMAQACAPRPAAAGEQSADGTGQPSRALSVLVVEDEPSVRSLIREVMQGQGCRVESEADASSALQAYRNSRHDLVLTDILMPGMDGLTLVRRLREEDPESVVVVITGRITPDSVKAALDAGAKMVLPKPFDLSELQQITDHLRLDPSGESLRALTRAEELAGRA